jgi:nucleoid DNA-binding protein
MASKSTKAKTKSDGTMTLKAVPQPATAVAPTVKLTPKVAPAAQSVKTKMLVKKPEFLDRAIARTAVKKRDAKPAIEAALAELAALLAEGNELNLPPLGKLKLLKSKDIGDGAKVMTLKLRTMKDSAGQPKPEDGA